MRITLDGPDGWVRGWLVHGSDPPVRLRRQQGGGGVMVWAAITDDTLTGPFRVPDGVRSIPRATASSCKIHISSSGSTRNQQL